MIGFRRHQRGDTILEVMMCVAVIGFVLTAAFALTSKNTTSQLKAQERAEALKVAETQLELFKSYVDINKLPDANMYFCAKADTTTTSGVRLVELTGPATPNPNINADASTAYPAECRYQDDLFSVAVWSPNKSNLIGGTSGIPYGVTVRWDAAGGGPREELKIFYNLYDTADPNFAVGGAPPDVCQNGRDDDGDGLTDWAGLDEGCTSASDNDETNPLCNNSIDDDGDGQADLADPGCYGDANRNSESPNPLCRNSIDDDGDGLIDAADPGCSGGATDNDETNPLTPFNATINGKDYIACAIAEGTWGDGKDGCFRTGNAMYAWREVKVTYSTAGVRAGPATLEIKYQEHGGPAPAGYTNYNFDVILGTTTTNHLLPVGAPGVQKTYSKPISIPASVPPNFQIEWKNNNGSDPDIRINSIRIFR